MKFSVELIKAIVQERDGAQLIADLVNENQRAKEHLRAKGYGVLGFGLMATVLEVRAKVEQIPLCNKSGEVVGFATVERA